ncbi:chorismate mutase [Escherichia coli]
MKKLYLIKLMFIAAIFFATSKALAGSYSVINLINERLSYMKDVAGYKAQHHQAIEDLLQEKKILQNAIADAGKLGIKEDTAIPFIQAQMDVAKAIQYRYRADWLSVPETDWKPRPLKDVREQIAQLNYRILQDLAKRLKSEGSLTEREKVHFMQNIQQQNLNEMDKLLIWNALRKVSLK